MARTEATSSTLATGAVGRTGDTVVFLHGFAQTGRCGGPVVEDLAGTHRVLLPDAPGHGGSLRHAPADLWATAELLAATTSSMGVPGPVHVLGYSLGARTALHLALAHPSTVRSLVLIGGTAGLDDPAERSARQRADRDLADRVEQVGVDAFLREWLDQPLFAGLPTWARFERERRSNTAAGLATSLRRCGTGAMEPLWDRLGELRVPALCIAGAEDAKFAALARRLAEALGGPAAVELAGGAGHAAHLERPRTTGAAVAGFLEAVELSRPRTDRRPRAPRS